MNQEPDYPDVAWLLNEIAALEERQAEVEYARTHYEIMQRDLDRAIAFWWRARNELAVEHGYIISRLVARCHRKLGVQ